MCINASDLHNLDCHLMKTFVATQHERMRWLPHEMEKFILSPAPESFFFRMNGCWRIILCCNNFSAYPEIIMTGDQNHSGFIFMFSHLFTDWAIRKIYESFEHIRCLERIAVAQDSDGFAIHSNGKLIRNYLRLASREEIKS